MHRAPAADAGRAASWSRRWRDWPGWRRASVFHAVRSMTCAETSCGHDGQKVQQFWKVSQFMEHLTGQQLHQPSGSPRVSQKDLNRITVCDLCHTLFGVDPFLAKGSGVIVAVQSPCWRHLQVTNSRPRPWPGERRSSRASPGTCRDPSLARARGPASYDRSAEVPSACDAR